MKAVIKEGDYINYPHIKNGNVKIYDKVISVCVKDLRGRNIKDCFVLLSTFPNAIKISNPKLK